MELGIIGNIGVIGIINERSAHGLAEARGRDKNFSGSGKNKGLKVFKVNKVGLGGESSALPGLQVLLL